MIGLLGSLSIQLNGNVLIVIPQVTPFHFGDEILNAGDTVSLTCTVGKGDLPLKIHWQLNDVDLSTGNGVVINRNGKRISVLSIENVQHEHIGNYTCIAENDAGISSHSAVLNVNGIKIYNCHEINFILFARFLDILCLFLRILMLSYLLSSCHRK